MLARLAAYLRGLARRREIDTEAEDELQFHLEQEVERNIARGMSAAEARRAALRDLGGLTQTREAVREVRTTLLDSVWYDARHAVRSLRRSPAFTAVVLLTLALGIGANTAILSIVNGVLLQPLPYPRPAQLMYLTTSGPVAVPGRGGRVPGIPAVQPLVRRRGRVPHRRGQSHGRRARAPCPLGHRRLAPAECARRASRPRASFYQRRLASSARQPSRAGAPSPCRWC